MHIENVKQCLLPVWCVYRVSTVSCVVCRVSTCVWCVESVFGAAIVA